MQSNILNRATDGRDLPSVPPPRLIDIIGKIEKELKEEKENYPPRCISFLRQILEDLVNMPAVPPPESKQEPYWPAPETFPDTIKSTSLQVTYSLLKRGYVVIRKQNVEMRDQLAYFDYTKTFLEKHQPGTKTLKTLTKLMEKAKEAYLESCNEATQCIDQMNALINVK